MKDISLRILENQLEIMDALEILLNPEKPKRKGYLINRERADLKTAMKRTGTMIEDELRKRAGIKQREKNPATVYEEQKQDDEIHRRKKMRSVEM